MQQHHAQRPHRQQCTHVEHEQHRHGIFAKQRFAERDGYKTKVEHANRDGVGACLWAGFPGRIPPHHPADRHTNSDGKESHHRRQPHILRLADCLVATDLAESEAGQQHVHRHLHQAVVGIACEPVDPPELVAQKRDQKHRQHGREDCQDFGHSRLAKSGKDRGRERFKLEALNILKGVNVLAIVHGRLNGINKCKGIPLPTWNQALG